MKNKKSIIITVILSLSYFICDFSFAQGLTTPCDGGDPDVDCPIDNGVIAILVITAAIFSFIKIYKSLSLKNG